MRALLFAILSGMLLAAAHATEFNVVQLDKSSVSFVSRQMNVPVEGTFKKFSAQIGIDPAQPQYGQAQVAIELNSIDVGSADANDEVAGRNWFNVREFPIASFVSSSVKSLGGGHYEAGGSMTIKGKSRRIATPFTLRQEQGALVVDGVFPIKRLDYGIGTGIWSDTATVADEVLIKFHFVVSPTRK